MYLKSTSYLNNLFSSKSFDHLQILLKMSGDEAEYVNYLTETLLEDYNLRQQAESTDDDINLLRKPLNVNSVGFEMTESSFHSTDKFELTSGNHSISVFRRGRPFSTSIRFDRPYNPNNEELHLTLEYGPQSKLSYENGTKFRIPVSSTSMNNQWNAVVSEINGTTAKIEVSIPANALVGLWTVTVDVLIKSLNSSPKAYKYHKKGFYVLFNPWCKDDEVFLDDEPSRQEYISNDHARIFCGTYNKPTFYSWVYGQFDYSVLPAIMILLEHTNLPHHKRGSAVLVSRAISAIINSADDNGLLVGNWVGNNEGGTAPEAWTGSTAIYQQYLESSGTPVKFAQCWVYAGCTTTAFRALGIPCRTVTCFNSAHDTDNTLTIDNYYDTNGKLTGKSRSIYCDSVWNFHCWNEVWIIRNDLPSGYDGWQVVDATPQEKSNGLYRCGPCPVKAVKEGDVGVNYDGTFVFAEVNADVCSFQEDSQSSWGFSLTSVDTDSVGKLLGTQSINQKEGYMEDITEQYKYPEGTSKEREVYYKTIKQNPTAQKFYSQMHKTRASDVRFTLESINSVSFGSHFNVNLGIENLSEETRNIDINLSANTVFYTRAHVDTVKQGQVKVDVKPKDKKFTTLQVAKEDYINKILKTNHVKVAANCKVDETGQTTSVEDFFEIIKINLTIEGPQEAKLGSKVDVVFTFKNPLLEELSNCFLTVEGTRLRRPVTFTIPNVASDGVMTKALTVVPSRVGPCTLVGIFSSSQLTHISGTLSILVHQ